MTAHRQIKVWDPLMRIFHWSLVVAFTVTYLSGDEESLLHANAGYVVLGLVLFRLVWGLIGTRHARFSDFLYSPRRILKFAVGMVSGRHQSYLGHNPLGGVMVIALLFSLLATSWTGLLTYAAEGKGPLAAAPAVQSPTLHKAGFIRVDDDDDWRGTARQRSGDEDEFWEELHELFANATLFLVFLHIGGVLVGTLIHHEPLIRAMITGKKPAADTDPATQ